MPSHGSNAWSTVVAARDASPDAVFRTTRHAVGLAATLDPPSPTGAYFAPGLQHRYSLWRIWNPALPRFALIGLNPSTADERVNDHTVRRCIGFAEREGCGGLIMLNLFAFRATDPKDMFAARDPIGPRNDAVLEAVVAHTRGTVAAWGVHGAHMGRGPSVLSRLRARGLRCFGVTKDGHPKHPLYLRGSIRLVEMHRGSLARDESRAR